MDEKGIEPFHESLSYQHYNNLGSNLSQHLRPRFQATEQPKKSNMNRKKLLPHPSSWHWRCRSLSRVQLEMPLKIRIKRFRLFSDCSPMWLVIENLSSDAKKIGLTEEAVQATVESRLRLLDSTLLTVQALPLRPGKCGKRRLQRQAANTKKWSMTPFPTTSFMRLTWKIGFVPAPTVAAQDTFGPQYRNPWINFFLNSCESTRMHARSVLVCRRNEDAVQGRSGP